MQKNISTNKMTGKMYTINAPQEPTLSDHRDTFTTCLAPYYIRPIRMPEMGLFWKQIKTKFSNKFTPPPGFTFF